MDRLLSMVHPLEELREAALREAAEAGDEQSLDAVRVRYLGKSGSISAWSEKMRSVPKEEKAAVGKLLNEARTGLTNALETAAAQLREQKEVAALANIDVTLPGAPHELGAIHPLTQML